MDLVKKLAIGAATISLASGLYAAPVLGVAEATNDNVTADSFADSEALDNDNVTVDSSNLGSNMLNLDVALASTGLNSQNRNEDGNDLSASNALAEYKTDNFLNVNEAVGQDGASASNSNITDNSDGDALAQDNDILRVVNQNSNTNMFNLTASVANTGLNSQNNNEDGNTMLAGTAYTWASSSNVVNHNVVKGTCGDSVCGVYDPTALALNTNISGDSFADSEAYDNDRVTVTNTNTNTNVINVTASVSNSGLNTQNGNEDGNSMTTGNTGSVAKANNYINVNETSVGGSSAQASNSNITDNSDGDALAQDNDRITVNNTNSGTNVVNVSAAVSNSGGNTQNNNEDGNSMTTGTAEAVGVTTNVVNANQVSW